MRTKVYQQILTELQADLDQERVERKWEIWGWEVSSLCAGVIQLTWLFVRGVVCMMGIAALIALLSLDRQSVVGLMEMSPDEWAGTLLTLSLMSKLFVIFSLILMGMIRLVSYRTATAHYQNSKRALFRDKAQMIELIEEVLYRHELILKEHKDEGEKHV